MLDDNDTENTPDNDTENTSTSTDPVTDSPADTALAALDPPSQPTVGAGPGEAAGAGGDVSGAEPVGAAGPAEPAETPAPAKKVARKRTTRTTTAKRTGTKKAAVAVPDTDQPTLPVEATSTPSEGRSAEAADAAPAPTVLSDGSAETADAPATPGDEGGAGDAPAVAPRKRTTRKTTAKKVAAKKAPAGRASKKSAAGDPDDAAGSEPGPLTPADAVDAGAAALGDLVAPGDPLAESGAPAPAPTEEEPGGTAEQPGGVDLEPVAAPAAASSAPSLLFKAPDPVPARSRRRVGAAPTPVTADEEVEEVEATDVAGLQQVPEVAAGDEGPGDAAGARADDPGTHDAEGDAGPDEAEDTEEADGSADDSTDEDDAGTDDEDGQGSRRRRRRGGRRRRRSGGGEDADAASTADQQPAEADDQPSGEVEDDATGGGRGSGQRGSRQKQSGQKGSDKRGRDKTGPEEETEADEQAEGTGSRRRRRRRRTGEEPESEQEDPQNTVTRVRKPRNAEDEITALHGSTRLEAKKQRRREGREAGRRRAPIVSEAEFLARREAVDRVMVIRQRADLTQIAVLEDQVLVEHYVARESQTSLIGNVYLGRVQNVLPSMEAAFIDIGKGRNAVLYAGEVNWDSLGAGNGPRKIESVLKSGQPILVQVSKDPIGHKGARLTSQISLPGRFLVYVPDGTTSGISRKLPDTERTRLKTLLKEIVPDSAGVIVRTAAEGASEEELTLDVERLTARWTDISSKAQKGNAPQLLYGEPDLTLKVVRDLFTEDFAKLVVSGDDAWDMVDTYVKHVAPDLEERLERYSDSAQDVFAAYRIDEQIAKGLDRKVWLPSGGSLIIDRTEAMTVVDVNTGKFTGSGGNLEETVTKNNLEAAEEMIRQLRLRDIGGIIVVDFIDMVLESNRDLVLRRLVECLGRDRTRHQVAEVTSLGLVQMTRKRIGTGLLEAFSETCEHCQGRGLLVHHEPVESHRGQDEEPRRGRRGRNRGSDGPDSGASSGGSARTIGTVAARPSPSPKDIAAIAKHDHRPVEEPAVDLTGEQVAPPLEQVALLPEPAGNAADAAVVPDVPLVDEPVVAVEPERPRSEPVASQTAAVKEPVPRHAEPVHPAEVASTPDATQAEPVTPPAPKGPVLVTSTRRRVARRPAGSATPALRPEAAAEPPLSQPTDSDGAGSQQSASSDSSAPAVPAETGGAPAAAPVLVTSTRRQVVRRPAGPPAGTTLDGQESDGSPGAVLPDGFGHVEVDGSSDAPSDHVPVDADGHHESAHVPVKRKGSRKR